MPDYFMTSMPNHTAKMARKAGFTLIEMSIVLVIIGLIIGGVLVGQDLIKSAALRAQISQIEKYNTAVNTFKEKTGYLPGDINAVAAAQFGFQARGTAPGEGDGNGILQGSNGTTAYGHVFAQGEMMVFWVDLSAAKLMDGNFSKASPTVWNTPSQSTIPSYLPAAKIGGGNFIYVFTNFAPNFKPGINFYGMSSNIAISNANGCAGCMTSTPGLTVSQASIIDQKIDDGLPQSGKVIAGYMNSNITILGDDLAWAAGGGNVGAFTGARLPTTAATVGSSTTCYDNSTSGDGQTAANGNSQHYSTEMNSGSGINCALSFEFQQ